MYREKFVLSVIHDGRPVKESGSRGSRQVAIPFGSEYKIRLKNKNDRGCTARVTIDGIPISNFGDIIVNAGGTVDLERFITSSMNNGKRFKFVDLDHPDVDDPTKSENGVVRVEFYLAKQKNGIKITPSPWEPPASPWYPWYECKTDITWVGGSNTFTSETTNKAKSSDTTVACYFNDAGMKSCSSFCDTEAGATVEGGHSGQSFTYYSLEVEPHATILELKIVGIRRGKRPVQGRYCTSCGHRIRKNDKYCGGCGRRV